MKPNFSPAESISARVNIPWRSKGLWLLLAAALVAAGLWAGSLARKGAAAKTDFPAALLAQSVPAVADHTSRDALIHRGEVNAAGNSGQPAADLQENFFDFGRISNTAPVTQSFILWNRGDAPLLIQRAYTTCACTEAQISSAEIPPGMASRITVQFDPRVHDVSGMTVRRGLVLELNDPANPSAEIWIQASVGE